MTRRRFISAVFGAVTALGLTAVAVPKKAALVSPEQMTECVNWLLRAHMESLRTSILVKVEGQSQWFTSIRAGRLG
jgi:hypothetical protein